MEGVIITLIVFAFVYATIRLIVNARKSKPGSLSGESDGSLGMSELKAVIREAVEEAQAPLLTRLAALEKRIDVRVAEAGTLSELPEVEALSELPEVEALPELPEVEALPELPEAEALPELPKTEESFKRRVRKRHR